MCKDEFLGLNYDFLSVQGIKCYKGVTTDGISSMPSQKTEKNCTEGVTQCLKKSTYYLPSGYIAPQGKKFKSLPSNFRTTYWNFLIKIKGHNYCLLTY